MKFAKLILLSFLIISCYPQKKPSNIDPKGDLAKIKLKGNNIYQGELITVRDSNIYMMNQNKITPISLTDIENVEIPGYSVDVGGRIGAALPSLLMQAFILMIASNIGEQTWVNIAGVSMLVTIGVYATAGSQVVAFSAPILENDIEQLRLYCRYPHELDTQVWHEIFKEYD